MSARDRGRRKKLSSSTRSLKKSKHVLQLLREGIEEADAINNNHAGIGADEKRSTTKSGTQRWVNVVRVTLPIGFRRYITDPKGTSKTSREGLQTSRDTEKRSAKGLQTLGRSNKGYKKARGDCKSRGRKTKRTRVESHRGHEYKWRSK